MNVWFAIYFITHIIGMSVFACQNRWGEVFGGFLVLFILYMAGAFDDGRTVLATECQYIIN